MTTSFDEEKQSVKMSFQEFQELHDKIQQFKNERDKLRECFDRNEKSAPQMFIEIGFIITLLISFLVTGYWLLNVYNR